MKFNELDKKYWLLNEKFRVKCKCGHTLYIVNKDKVICNYCGRYVFKDKEAEFKYRIEEKIKNN